MPVALFALLCLIWSTTWSSIRICERGFTPFWAATFRFVIASLALWVYGRIRNRANAGAAGEWKKAGWLLPAAGLVNAASYSLIYVAERRISGGTAAVLGATNPFFVMGVAVAFGYERISARKILGLAVGFAGILALFHSGWGASRAMAVSMAEVLFAAAVLWPTYTVLLRKTGERGVSTEVTTLGFLFCTAVALCLFAPVAEGMPKLPSAVAPWAALLYLALVGSALAWSLFNHLLRVLELTVLSTMLFIEPCLALGIDWLLGEKSVSASSYSGAALVLLGVLLAAVGQPKEPLAGAVPAEA